MNSSYTVAVSSIDREALGILLAGLLRAERTVDRWEVARAPLTLMIRRGSRVLLVPKMDAARLKTNVRG